MKPNTCVAYLQGSYLYFSILRLLSLTVIMNRLLLLIACGTYLAESSIETFDDITELSGKNFDSYLKEHDTFVMFYAPW